MLSYKEAEKVILANHKGCYVNKAAQIRDLFVFVLLPDRKTEDVVVDNVFAVNRKTGKEVGYSPSKNPKEHNKAFTSSVVYQRS